LRHSFSLVEFLHDPTPQLLPGQQVPGSPLGQSPSVGQGTR
jgi:hypothetical protein